MGKRLFEKYEVIDIDAHITEPTVSGIDESIARAILQDTPARLYNVEISRGNSCGE